MKIKILDTEKLCDALTLVLNSIERTKSLRPQLIETPKRIVSSYKELFDGYDVDVSSLFKVFDEGLDQLILIKDIEFTSFCEHHFLPFQGYAHIAYLPKNNRAIGASKIPRLVSAYAHRLQVQERITRQIADSIMKYLDPLGVAVILEATHFCISCRGVKNKSARMVTSVMLGIFREDSDLRLELLNLLKMR